MESQILEAFVIGRDFEKEIFLWISLQYISHIKYWKIKRRKSGSLRFWWEGKPEFGVQKQKLVMISDVAAPAPYLRLPWLWLEASIHLDIKKS